MTSTAPVTRQPKNPLSQPIPIRLLPREIERVEKFAQQDSRSRASFMRLMLLRGLQSYEAELEQFSLVHHA
jgi:hypothetical protein